MKRFSALTLSLTIRLIIFDCLRPIMKEANGLAAQQSLGSRARLTMGLFSPERSPLF